MKISPLCFFTSKNEVWDSNQIKDEENFYLEPLFKFPLDKILLRWRWCNERKVEMISTLNQDDYIIEILYSGGNCSDELYIPWASWEFMLILPLKHRFFHFKEFYQTVQQWYNTKYFCIIYIYIFFFYQFLWIELYRIFHRSSLPLTINAEMPQLIWRTLTHQPTWIHGHSFTMV